MKKLNDFMPRNAESAKLEVANGMHHTGYWWITISKLLGTLDVHLNQHGYDAVSTGEYWGVMTDPVTGKKYDLQITPQKVK